MYMEIISNFSREVNVSKTKNTLEKKAEWGLTREKWSVLQWEKQKQESL